MKINEAIVFRFHELCDERKIKLNSLARLAGISPSTVYSMANSTRKEIKVNTVEALCEGLEISIRQFFDSDIFDNIDPEIQ